MALPGTPVEEGNLNHLMCEMQLKDILQTYNRVTELCFRRCASNFNYHKVTSDEQSCVDSCSGKFILSNQKIMSTFVELQSVKQQQMLSDAMAQQQVADPGTQLQQAALDTPDVDSGSRT